MKRICLAIWLALIPATAFAYVGPGAGLSLLGALWALIAAVGLAVAFVVAWPIRKMMRRKRAAARQQPAVAHQQEAPAHAPREGTQTPSSSSSAG